MSPVFASQRTEWRLPVRSRRVFWYSGWFPPCLLTVQSDINTPPLPTLAGKKRSYSIDVDLYSSADLAVEMSRVGLSSSPTRVVKISHPKITRRTERFLAKHVAELETGISRIIEILAESSII